MSELEAARVPLSALDDNFLDANRLFVVDSKRGEYVERRDRLLRAACGNDELGLPQAAISRSRGDGRGGARLLRRAQTGLQSDVARPRAAANPRAARGTRLAPARGSDPRDDARAAGGDA